LWVTGALGAVAAAVRAWEDGREPDRQARERFARPAPRVSEARWLAERGATALIDVSDGLLGDVGHLAAASQVRCVIESERVPVHVAADRPDDAVVGGEEYELVVSLPSTFGRDEASQFSQRFGLPFTRVGSVEEGAGVILLEQGRPVELPAGFLQFD
jgi:thiamine-monophosphate kinase